jgi:hypothetical protein
MALAGNVSEGRRRPEEVATGSRVAITGKTYADITQRTQFYKQVKRSSKRGRGARAHRSTNLFFSLTNHGWSFSSFLFLLAFAQVTRIGQLFGYHLPVLGPVRR